MAIRSFKDKRTKAVFEGEFSRGFSSDPVKTGRRKLAVPDAAETLRDLASPPGNKLEALQGDRTGQHSIRINRQFRVCFRWTDGGPEDVEIADYH